MRNGCSVTVEKHERYREKNVESERKVEEAKRMSNFKWGQDFDRSYEENKKKFWKEVRKGGSRTEETVKDVNGRLLRGNEARKRWAENFEDLLNVQEDKRGRYSGSRRCSSASNGKRE